MTKKKKKTSSVTNPDQTCLALFDIISADASRVAGVKPGCLCNDAEFKAALADDAKHAVDDTGRELSRWEIAARMSTILNREVTWHMINNWTASSHENHMPELQELVAFVIATGGQRRAVSALFRPAGIFPLPSPGALRSEMQHLRERKKALTHKEKECKLLLQQLERGVHV